MNFGAFGAHVHPFYRAHQQKKISTDGKDKKNQAKSQVQVEETVLETVHMFGLKLPKSHHLFIQLYTYSFYIPRKTSSLLNIHVFHFDRFQLSPS